MMTLDEVKSGDCLWDGWEQGQVGLGQSSEEARLREQKTWRGL